MQLLECSFANSGLDVDFQSLGLSTILAFKKTCPMLALYCTFSLVRTRGDAFINLGGKNIETDLWVQLYRVMLFGKSYGN
jgi:hypothetical protein